jgi:hypothetical protein
MRSTLWTLHCPKWIPSDDESNFSAYLGKFCVLYLDDMVSYNKTADEHLEHFQFVLRELQRNQFHVKLS